MTLLELKHLISDMIANDSAKADATVRVLTETDEVQVEQDAYDLAYVPGRNCVVILPEGFDEPKGEA